MATTSSAFGGSWKLGFCGVWCKWPGGEPVLVLGPNIFTLQRSI